ncbi:MAG: MFS transporter, partial [Cyanobacteria bacterium HKST-UBA05]|nr:MFS transporter [Cyanobacteria bacterium HKST-UBA05]
ESLKSYLYIAFTIPAILLTAVAGVFVDRWHRQRTLVVTNALRGLCVLFIPLAIAHNQLMGLYACAFAISTVTQFFVPAEAATIPMIVRPTQLLVANSLFTTTMMASLVFGFTLGDPLIEWLGLVQVHWSLFAMYVLATLSVAWVGAGYPSKKAEARLDEQPETLAGALDELMADMKDGFAYLRGHWPVLHKIVLLAILFSVVVAATILFISFAKEMLYANPVVASRKFVWLITTSGLGMVVASVGIGRYARNWPKHRLVYTGFVVIGLGLLGLLATPMVTKTMGLAVPGLGMVYSYKLLYAHTITFVMGLGAAFVAVPLQSVLHIMIPEDKRGKVLGIQFTLLSACSTFPVLLAGLGAEWLGAGSMLLLGGAPLLMLGLWGLYDGNVKTRLGTTMVEEQYGPVLW